MVTPKKEPVRAGERTSEEDRWIHLIKEGRPEGGQWLIDHFGERVAGLCRGMLNDRTEAEDALQEVFLKIWRSRANLPSVRNMTAWILKVATNECLDRIKSRRRKETAVLPDDQLDLNADGAAVAAPIRAALNEDNAAVVEAIKRLPGRYKLAVLYKFQQQLSNGEVAQLLGVSPGNLRVLLCRALAMIRKDAHDTGTSRS